MVGFIGALHPAVGVELGLNAPLYLCEIDLGLLLEGSAPDFKELSKFPEIRRDLAVVVDKSVSAAELMDACESGGRDLPHRLNAI